MLTAFFCATLFISAQVFAGDYEEAITRGSRAVDRKDYKLATKEFEKAVKINPDDSKGHLLLGLVLANTGEYDRAIQHTSKAVKMDPSYSAYHNLGLVYANQGDYQKSLENYKKALEFNPSSYRAWYQMGLLESSQGHFREAMVAYKKSIELNPQFANAYLGLGSSYYWAGDTASARAQVQALRKIGDKNTAAALEKWLTEKESKKNKVLPAS